MLILESRKSSKEIMYTMVSGQFPAEKSPPPQLRLGFGSRLGLVLGLADNQTIAPKENSPPVRVRVWTRVS